MAVFGNGDWQGVPARLVGHCPGPVDISILAPSVLLTPSGLPVEPGSNGVVYGQEVFFLGFPYGMRGNVVFTERGYPLPLVKRASLSCFDGERLLLDGHHNPGFSGGPVVFGTPGALPTRIAAVVHGYRSAMDRVLAGRFSTFLSFRYNTGIMIAYRIEHATSLVRANPCGVPVS